MPAGLPQVFYIKKGIMNAPFISKFYTQFTKTTATKTIKVCVGVGGGGGIKKKKKGRIGG